MSLVDAGLQHEIEQFLYREAELLDERRFGEWYALFAEDVRYWMPIQANRLRRDRDADVGPGDGEDIALLDDDKTTLGWRVRQLSSATHWAEDPPSRTRHLITNVRIARRDHTDAYGAAGYAPDEYDVRSNFMVYRNRLADEVDLWVGERRDVLRRTAEGFSVASRTVMLDQSVVLSKNLSVLF